MQQLTYLVNLLHFSGISGTLKSSVSKQLFVTMTKLGSGKCAFSVAAPTVWNQLPIAIRSSETIATFCKKNQMNLLFMNTNFL